MQQACCVGVKDTTEFKGTFQTLKNGKKFYQTDEKRTRVVVLLTDVFGIKNINNPLVIADKIHENTGLTVIVPDLFDGKEMPDFMEESFKSQRSTSYWLKAKFNCYAVFCVLGFLLKNSQQESLNILQEHVKNLKEEGVTSVGLLGYCWGGKVVLEGCLVEGLGDIVKCGVACHPGAFDLGKHSYPEVFKKQSKPMLYCLAEIDREISPKQVEEIKEICVKNSEGKDDGFQTAILYPGTLHGFAARGEDFNPAVKAARQDALERQFEFFKKHL